MNTNNIYILVQEDVNINVISPHRSYHHLTSQYTSYHYMPDIINYLISPYIPYTYVITVHLHYCT